MNKLAKYIKQSRELNKLSQQQVATSLKYTTPQFISNWERGLAAPPLSNVKKIARAIKIDPQELGNMIIATALEQKEQLMRRNLTKALRKS